MRSLLVMLFACLCGLPAVHAEGIVEVLQRSQQQRLQQRGAADASSAAAERIRASLQRMAQLDPDAASVQLVLVSGDLYAEALFGGRRLAVSEVVGTLPEGQRLLLLAHELGHLTLGHWKTMSSLYLRHIPGDVRPETTDPVAPQLSAQAHALSHRQEFEADGYGFSLVHKLGFGLDNAFGLLTQHGLQFDSPTHPGTRRRLAQLRALDAQLASPLLRTGEPATVAGAVLPQPD
jgi:hypothetical protein